MRMNLIKLLSGTLMILSLQLSAQSAGKITDKNIPLIPVGTDAYIMWNRWPQQLIGTRAYMRSTYDRRGANEGADASHFLFVNEETYNVTVDVKGTGVLYFFRANHWHGSPWRFIADGTEIIVQETGTKDPINAKANIKKSEFIPSAPFPEPLNYTWATTKGADLIWTPMPFKESFRIAYSRTRYGTGYYIYHLYADGNNLSQPIKTWHINQVPDKEVLDLINRSGTDIAPKNIKRKSGTVRLNKESLTIATIKASPSSVRALKLTIPMDKALDLERLRLQVTWDDAAYPSIDAPLCLFFGAGTFYNRDEKEYLVKAFPVNVKYDFSTRKVELGCYFPMPFFSSAKFELSGITPDNTTIDYEIRYEPMTTPENHTSYFHATYTDIPMPVPGVDMIYLDTEGIEGHKDWSGSFVGNSFIFSHDGVLNTLEADPRFFFDDSKSPQAYGTGTEEWGGGGDYWGGENMTLPFAGHPCGVGRDKSKAMDKKDLIESAYRFLLADKMPFGRRAIITFEHGGDNLSTEHYEAVTYWYGMPSPLLVKSDDLDIGNLKSEKDHNYISPEGSVIEYITSRYELGIDVFPDSVTLQRRWPKVSEIPGYKDLIGKAVYPEHMEDGRFTRGASEFTANLHPDNRGVLLRRTLDYSFQNQTAEVYISDPDSVIDGSYKWTYAGIWYLAGSNVYIYSNPKGEMDLRQLNIQISNRRFRDDEFLLPATLTQNKRAIRVRLKYIRDNQELYPGLPYPRESAWSELRYEVYSYVLPELTKGMLL
jgi:hypothetical protein